MKNSQLDRLLRFAQRTGDRLIITDSEGQQPVVILSLDEYEALLDGRSQAAPESRQPVREDEEVVDLKEIEAAVEAVNREYSEEPKVVPVARKQQPSDPGEEQFYLEPV
jgi:hypothetical protein